VLMVDISGSIGLDKEEQTVGDAIRTFNRCQSEQDRHMILAFNEENYIIVADRIGRVGFQQLETSIRGLRWGGRTNLGSALLKVLIETRSWPPTTIILVTDGIDTERRADHAFPTLIKRQVRVVPIMIGPTPDTALLTQIASLTGGETYHGNEANISWLIQKILP
jgi:uncharacterized protein with von Willebrand factor type A (vWA) domain